MLCKNNVLYSYCMTRLLDYDPSRRPGATQCLAHPFIAGMSTSLSPPVCSPMCIAPEEFEFEQRKLSIEDLRAEVALESESFHFITCFDFVDKLQ